MGAGVAALIEQADAGPARMAGHDWGGAVGYLVAAVRPELVTHFAAVETVLPGFGLAELADVRRGSQDASRGSGRWRFTRGSTIVTWPCTRSGTPSTSCTLGEAWTPCRRRTASSSGGAARPGRPMYSTGSTGLANPATAGNDAGAAGSARSAGNPGRERRAWCLPALPTGLIGDQRPSSSVAVRAPKAGYKE